MVSVAVLAAGWLAAGMPWFSSTWLPLLRKLAWALSYGKLGIPRTITGLTPTQECFKRLLELFGQHRIF